MSYFSFISLFIVGSVFGSILNLKPLNATWGDVKYKDEPYQKMDLNLTASRFTISGFSSGGYMTTNLLAMFNEHIDGAAILSGDGPCATRGMCANVAHHDSYPTDGYKDKPIFFYSGT